jgi:hypothetical protein
MPKPPRVLTLDEIDPIRGPGTLTWLPLRYTLGIRAFGCNAYVAEDRGEDVVEPHTEDPKLAHEELYFVARGRATFRIDGQTYDAPAGTYVFIPDPACHRHAVAAEPRTTVLSFGGPPTFEPSAWEWSFRAAPLARSHPERAREILAEGLSLYPESGGLHYGVACVEALAGDRDRALASLRRAIELRPELKRRAADDADLQSLHDAPAFRALTDV